MKPPFLVLFLLGLLAGCSSPLVKPVSLADIAAIEVTLTEAERVAGIYTHAAPCAVPAVQPCAIPKLVLTIRADAHAAHDRFKELQAATVAGRPAAMAVLTTALNVLTAETPVDATP